MARVAYVSAAAFVLLALAGSSLAGEGSALDGAPPLGGTPPPSASAIKPCGTFVTGKAAVIATSAKAKGTFCGSQQADRITVTGGAGYIETYGGVDYVNARNGKPDEVWNGSGLDEGLYDSCDRVYDLDRGTKSRAACPGVSTKSKFRAPQRTRYPVKLPSVSCEADSGGGRRFRLGRGPTMRAFDSTGEVDWQNVAWSALLFEKVGEEIVLRAQTEWVWDRAYDEQVKAFPGNTWRTFLKNVRMEFSEIRRNEPGTYRVAFHFKWYGGDDVPEREVRVWASKLFKAARRSRC